MEDFEKALRTLLSDAMGRGVPPLSLCEATAQATANMLTVCREQAETAFEREKDDILREEAEEEARAAFAEEDSKAKPSLLLPERYRK